MSAMYFTNINYLRILFLASVWQFHCRNLIWEKFMFFVHKLRVFQQFCVNFDFNFAGPGGKTTHFGGFRTAHYQSDAAT